MENSLASINQRPMTGGTPTSKAIETISTPKKSMPVHTASPYSTWKSTPLLPVFGKIVIIRNGADVNAFLMSQKVCRLGRYVIDFLIFNCMSF